MEIDERVEPLVRQAIAAAVEADVDRLDAGLQAFPDEDARRKGLELAIAIAGAVLYDSHDGRPSPEQVRHVAAGLAATSAWAGVTAEDAYAYLSTVLDGGSLAEVLEPRIVVLLAFVVAAGLLAAETGHGEEWASYLDRVEAQLGAVPS